jgi:hypothetical protein
LEGICRAPTNFWVTTKSKRLAGKHLPGKALDILIRKKETVQFNRFPAHT